MKVAGAKIQGQTHRKNNKLCQDHIKYRTKNNTLFAALADGAGSRKYGGESAEIVVEIVDSYFKRKRKIYEKYENVSKDIETLFENKLKEKHISKNEAGTTLLFVAVRGNRYIAGHVGDGVIIMKNNDGIRVLSEPENGRYVFETFFLPQESNADHFRIYSGEIEEGDGFILASDGIAEAIYRRSDKKIAGKAAEKLIKWISSATKKEGEEILENNLDKILMDYSHDDKSIVVISI